MAKFTKNICNLMKQSPLIAGGVVFIMISWPINHFFLKDYPDNPLEKMESFVFKNIIGIDVEEEDL